MMYLAVFFTQNSTYGPLLGEMDFRDGNGRRMTPANAVLDHGVEAHWSAGNVTDDDLTVYYYDTTGVNAFIAHFTDNAPVVSAKFHRGHSTSFAQYSPIGIRVYQSETNYGTTESNWPVETKLVDETYTASTVGWTDEYPLNMRTVSLDITEDAMVSYYTTAARDVAYGQSGYVYMAFARYIGFFKVPTLSEGESVLSAKLQLTAYAANGASVLDVYSVDDDWQQNSITYNNSPARTFVRTASVNAHAINDSIEIDLTGVDTTYGVAFGGDGTSVNVHSSEATTPAYRPKVEYTIKTPWWTPPRHKSKKDTFHGWSVPL